MTCEALLGERPRFRIYRPGARYWIFPAFRKASIVSSTVSRTVVSNELSAEPDKATGRDGRSFLEASYPAAMRQGCLLVAGLAVALALSGTAASATSRPSERACLLAWNAPTNVASRPRVAAGGPWVSASLRPGTTSTVTWQRGSAPQQTTAQACLLTLVRSGGFQPVTGIWRAGRVVRWSFRRAVKADGFPGGSNVKVLPDGRVTKIYLR